MIYDNKTKKLLNYIKSLNYEPDRKTLQSDILNWFIDNIVTVNNYDKYPIFYFLTQEPEYKLWESLSYHLSNKIYLDLFSYETRYNLYYDLGSWLIKSIKKNYIAEL